MRIHSCVRALNTSYEDFCLYAVMQAVDEIESVAREVTADLRRRVEP